VTSMIPTKLPINL